MFETLTRTLFAARVCIVATQPCDLRWHKHQQKKHRKFCSGLPGAVLAAPFTNSVRKRPSFSDVNSWRSYEQCLFFSCFVCCVHVNMGVRMNVRMPVGFDSTALPFFIRQMSLCLMGSTFPSFLNISMNRSLSSFIAHNPQCNFVLDVWAVRRSNFQSAPKLQNI